ncbi:hypothetical protein FACS189490_07970 [Clostridia bacterium]|nr:hypothetical protein FACS189490_07970 [Clostridia bacterium]
MSDIKKRQKIKNIIITTIAILTIGIISIVLIVTKTSSKNDLILMGNWEIEIKETEILDKVLNGYSKNEPKEGSVYIVVGAKIKNISTERATFDTDSERSGTPSISLLYKEKYTFKPTHYLLLYTENLYKKELNPLESLTGTLVYEVAEEVANKKYTKMVIKYNGKTITRKLY